MTDLISREAVCKIVADRVTDKFEKKAVCHGIRALPSAQVKVKPLVWEPVDTAPKDGTRVILWRGPAEFGKQSEMVIAEWHGGEWQWPDEAENPCTHGEWSEEDRQGGYYSDGRYFTHWMPLPTAPVDASQMPDPATKMRCAECWCDGGYGDAYCTCGIDAAAKALCAARDLVQALMDEVERLTKERDRFEAALGRACLVGGTTYLIERAEAAEAKVEKLEAAVIAAAKIGQIVGFLGSDEDRIEAFREACGPELWAKARAALARIEGEE